MVKECTKCREVKAFSEFSKSKTGKYGIRAYCKSCQKKYREANKEYYNEYSKEYYKANKDKLLEQQKKYREANKEHRKEYNKRWREANKEHYKKYKKKYLKEYYKANKEYYNEYKKEYQKKRKQTDPLYKLKHNLRSRTSMAFKNKGYSKNTKTQDMLGVDWEVAKKHIERQFKKGMSWDNYGDWHIDHIIPLASANTEKRLKELCHYTNLQPLWAEENLSKNASINNQQTRMRI